MIQALIDYWRRAELSEAPFIHPDDAPHIPARLRHSPVSSADDYARAFVGGSISDDKFHLTLLPQPYLGHLTSARVAVLLLNPGIHPADFLLLEHYPHFQEQLRATIKQEQTANPYLDPRWAWTSGFVWWEQKFRDVAKLIAQHQYDGNYIKALELLSRKVVCIELVPYHSRSFRASTALPSSQMARNAACEIAKDPNRTVIVTRGVKDWGISEGPNVVKYSGGQTRGASLGPNSAGGRAILSAFEVR